MRTGTLKEAAMAIAFVFTSAEVDQALYDLAMKGINRESLDSPTPNGLIAHLSGPASDAGWRVVDVWESEDAANSFYGSPQFQEGVVKALPPIDVQPWPMYRLEIEHTLRVKA
jgi:hypothetical protein